MTREELVEMLENAILTASDGYMSNPNITNAVIEALTPMMTEVVEAISDLMPFDIVQGDCFQRTNPHTKIMGNSSMAWAVSNGDRSAHKIRERIFKISEALFSLKCFAKPCEHHWVGGGSDTFRSVHCAKCGAAHKDNFSNHSGECFVVKGVEND